MLIHKTPLDLGPEFVKPGFFRVLPDRADTIFSPS